MGFSLDRLGEHTEKRVFEIYEQKLVYEFRPAALTKPLQRRLQQLEDLDRAARAEFDREYEAWEEAGGEGEEPVYDQSPALDELCAITQKVIAAWDIEADGKPVPVDQVRERVEDGTIPLLLLFKVFGDAIAGGQEVPKRGGRRGR